MEMMLIMGFAGSERWKIQFREKSSKTLYHSETETFFIVMSPPLVFGSWLTTSGAGHTKSMRLLADVSTLKEDMPSLSVSLQKGKKIRIKGRVCFLKTLTGYSNQAIL